MARSPVALLENVAAAEPAPARMPRLIKPSVRSDLLFASLDDGAVVFDPRTQHTHYLNPEAALVFQLLDGTESVSACAREIAEAAGLPEPRVERQVRTVVRKFRTARMIEEPQDPNDPHAAKPTDSRKRIRKEVPRST